MIAVRHPHLLKGLPLDAGCASPMSSVVAAFGSRILHDRIVLVDGVPEKQRIHQTPMLDSEFPSHTKTVQLRITAISRRPRFGGLIFWQKILEFSQIIEVKKVVAKPEASTNARSS